MPEDRGGTGAAGMPQGTLQFVWGRRNDWAWTAKVGKRRYEQARDWALLLVGLGAAFGALVGLVAAFVDTQASPIVPAVIAFLSASCMGAGAFVGREFLDPQEEQSWVTARYLAEALQREVWRVLTGAAPYHAGDVGETLRTRAEAMLRDVKAERVEVPSGERITPFPTYESFDDYRTGRVLDQISWYKRRVREFQGRRSRMRRLIFLLGLLSVIAGLVGIKFGWVTGLVPFLAALLASTRLFVESSRFDALVRLYQQTETQLGVVDAVWQDRAGSAAELAPDVQVALRRAYVDECERLMEQENQSWRADVMSQEKAKRLFDAVQAAAEDVPGKPAGGQHQEAGRSRNQN